MRPNDDTQSEPQFSIIVPVLNEADIINPLIDHINKLGFENQRETIIVDGDPQGRTINAITSGDVTVIISPPGRAKQMNAGAELARGGILIFLHADTILPPNALEKICLTMQNGKYVAGAFDLGIDSASPLLKFTAARVRSRTRRNRIPYGDQAIFIKKSYFDMIGRYADIPIMEDVDLMRRIKKRGDNIFIIKDRVSTSPRRWKREGVIYTTIRNRVLVSLFYLGVNPDILAKYYKSGYAIGK